MISVEKDFTTEILLISADFCTKNGLSTEVEISRRLENSGENVADAVQRGL